MKELHTSQKVSLGGEAVRLTISKMITLGISMLTSMLLSRFRTFEEYGTYSQLLLVINLFSSLFMLGLPNSINYFLARADTPDERRRFLSIYYTLSTILSIILGMVLVLCIPLFEAYFKNELIGRFFYFFALYPWSTIISSSIENLLIVYKKTGFLMRYRVVNSVMLLLPVIVVQVLGLGFSAYMISFIAINSLFALYVYHVANRLGEGIKPLFNAEFIKTIFIFSIPIGLSSVVGTLNTEIDKLMIGYLMNTEQMAIYTNAAKELPMAIVPSSITAVLLPQLARFVKRGKNRDAIQLWGVATELAFIIICFLVSGVFSYAEEVMTILYSSKYLPGVSVFRVYTLNLLLRVTYFGIFLNACGETKKIFRCSVISLILNAIMNPILYICFGMIGPAIATFVAILITLLLQLNMTSKVSGVPFFNVFPWCRLLYILFINIGFACIFWTLKVMIPLDQIIGNCFEGITLGLLWGLLYFMFMRKKIHVLWNRLNEGGRSFENNI